MKKFISSIIITLIPLLSFCQDTTDVSFDKKINTFANDLNNRIASEVNGTIAFYAISRQTTSNQFPSLSEYIANELAGELALVAKRYSVLSRNKMQEIFNEKNQEYAGITKRIDSTGGGIDDLGKLLSANVIILIESIKSSNSYRVTATVVEVSTGRIIAPSRQYFSANEIGGIIGLNQHKDDIVVGDGDTILSPTLKECEKFETGDFCYDNNSRANIVVYVYENGKFITQMMINAHSNRCCILKAGTYRYKVEVEAETNYSEYILEQDIRIKECGASYAALNDNNLPIVSNKSDATRNNDFSKSSLVGKTVEGLMQGDIKTVGDNYKSSWFIYVDYLGEVYEIELSFTDKSKVSLSKSYVYGGDIKVTFRVLEYNKGEYLFHIYEKPKY